MERKNKIGAILFFFLVLLSSCGVFRTVEKEKHSLQVKSSVKTDSTVRIEKNTIDKSKKVIEERLKGSFSSPPVVAEWYTSLHPDSLEGRLFFQTDHGMVEITNSLNEAGTGINQKAIFTANPVEVDIDRKTIIENDIIIQENSDIDFSSEESIQLKEKSLDVKKEGKNSFWFVVGGVLVFLVTVWFGVKKLRL